MLLWPLLFLLKFISFSLLLQLSLFLRQILSFIILSYIPSFLFLILFMLIGPLFFRKFSLFINWIIFLLYSFSDICYKILSLSEPFIFISFFYLYLKRYSWILSHLKNLLINPNVLFLEISIFYGFGNYFFFRIFFYFFII